MRDYSGRARLQPERPLVQSTPLQNVLFEKSRRTAASLEAAARSGSPNRTLRFSRVKRRRFREKGCTGEGGDVLMRHWAIYLSDRAFWWHKIRKCFVCVCWCMSANDWPQIKVCRCANAGLLESVHAAHLSTRLELKYREPVSRQNATIT